MFVRTYTGAVAGIGAVAVTVEVSITGGGTGLFLVGLPDNAVKESEQRIRSAYENSGFRMTQRKCVVNLALPTFARRVRALICLLRWLSWPLCSRWSLRR